MERELYDILKVSSEYKLFKKKNRSRSIDALLILVAFWTIIIMSTDFHNIDDVSMIYFGVLVIATLFLLKYIYGAFVKRPQMIAVGIITDIREKRRTVHEKEHLQTRLSYQYLVHCNDNDLWAESVYEFIDGHGKRHNVGEQVLYFSMSPGNSYIIVVENGR